MNVLYLLLPLLVITINSNLKIQVGNLELKMIQINIFKSSKKFELFPLEVTLKPHRNVGFFWFNTCFISVIEDLHFQSVLNTLLL